MSVIKGKNFYLIIEKKTIFLCTKLYCTSYPIWFARNRSHFTEFKHRLAREPLNTIADVLAISAELELASMVTYRPVEKDKFLE